MSEVNGPQKPVALNYGGNSNRQKDAVAVTTERVKIDKVISGIAVERKKGFGRKIKDHFQGEDARTIAEHVFWDVILPKIKDLAFDAISETASRTFYGDTSSRRVTTSGRVTARPTAYNRIGYQGVNEARTISPRARVTHDFSQDILIPTIGEAEKVLDTLAEYIEKYGFVSVMDLYDAVGVTNGEFTDEKHGWDDIRTAKPIRTRDGYILDLPPTKQRD